MWTSVDGLTWSRVSLDEAVFGDGEPSDVIAGGPGLVAVGADVPNAAVWTSVDGLTWSQVPHDEAVFGGEGQQWMNSVTVGGPGLVAVGGGSLGAAVWTSADGLTWSLVPHDERAFGRAAGLGGLPVLNGVTAGGPGLVAVGTEFGGRWADPAAVWTSVDGITWSRVPHGDALGGQLDVRDGDRWMSSATVGGPGLVAVGGNRSADPVTEVAAEVWTSVDGVTWSRVPQDEAIFGRGEMSNVTAGGPGLVAVGSDGSDAAVWVAATEAEAVEVAGDGVDVGQPLPVAPGSVFRIDPETNEFIAIQTGLGDVSPRVVVGEGAVWAVERGGRALAQIDPETNSVARTVEIVGDTIEGVAIGEGSVWVTSSLAGEGVLVEIDAGTGRFRRAVGLGYSELLLARELSGSSLRTLAGRWRCGLSRRRARSWRRSRFRIEPIWSFSR